MFCEAKNLSVVSDFVEEESGSNKSDKRGTPSDSQEDFPAEVNK